MKNPSRRKSAIGNLMALSWHKNTLRYSYGLLVLVILTGCGLIPKSNARPEPVSQTSAMPSNPTVTVNQNNPAPVQTPTRNVSYLPLLANLNDGWNQIITGGETSCAHGGEYSFFVRKTNSSRLMVYFEGGGSCYDAESCRVGSNRYDDSIDTAFPADNPALKDYGLFALDDVRNPFREDNIVFINYCTGDGFMGNRVVQYQDSQGNFEINHVGFINTQTVFAWIYQNFPQPEKVAMVGCSAGVNGAFFNLPYFKKQYPDLPLVVVGDSGGGFIDGPAIIAERYGALDLLPSWIPQYDQLVSGNLFQSKYIFAIPAQVYPESRFGLIDTESDSVQAGLLTSFNPNLSLGEVLRLNSAALQAEAPNFFTYIGSGDNHCVTMDGAYYDFASNGIKLNDWLTRLLGQEPVSSVAP